MAGIQNIADYLFEKSKNTVRLHPGSLADVLDMLIWTMDDNGGEIIAAIERWLQSEDYERVREGLHLKGVFPFRDEAEMSAVLQQIKNRWPDLAPRCDEVALRRSRVSKQGDEPS